MTLKSDGVLIHAINESGLIELDLLVKTTKVQQASEKNLEDLCAELLSQLKIITDVEGKIGLTLIEINDEEKDEIIYKRSHYINNRYFIISVFENNRGVYLLAVENETNVFNMKLGQRRVGNSQKVQEELFELIKKLKIQVILGQEMLVLSTS